MANARPERPAVEIPAQTADEMGSPTLWSGSSNMSFDPKGDPPFDWTRFEIIGYASLVMERLLRNLRLPFENLVEIICRNEFVQVTKADLEMGLDVACIYLRQEFFNISPFNESHKLHATNPSPREALANWHRELRYEGAESLDDWTREDLLPYFGRMCTAVETAMLRVYSSRDLPGQDEDLRGIFLPEANSGPAQNNLPDTRLSTSMMRSLAATMRTMKVERSGLIT